MFIILLQTTIYSSGEVDRSCSNNCIDGYNSSINANVTCCNTTGCNNAIYPTYTCNVCDYCTKDNVYTYAYSGCVACGVSSRSGNKLFYETV